MRRRKRKPIYRTLPTNVIITEIDGRIYVASPHEIITYKGWTTKFWETLKNLI